MTPEECMHRKPLLIVGATIIASGVLLNAQAPNQLPAPASSQAVAKANPAIAADRMFITEVWTDGMAEVELGKLASEKASDEKVRMFGQRMVMDHGKAGDDLTTLAASKQVTLPASLDSKHKAVHDRLARLSGAQFDAAYIRQMVAGHRKAVDAFTKESASGQDSEVQAWATRTLPTIREHLAKIEGIQKEIFAAQSTR
jgi:putative membrane protein